MAGKGFFDSARTGYVSEEEMAINALFPADSKFKMLQMITEISPKSEMPWTVLGLLRRRFKSKVLEVVQEENNLNKIAQDRKGRLELSEIVSSPRRKKDEED